MASTAFLFDLNGTIVDDMAYHKKVWYHVLVNDLGANMSFEQVAAEMYGKNSELLDRVFGKGHFSPEQVQEIEMAKERKYQEIYRPVMKPLPGLMDFLEAARSAGIPMAIGSAAIPFNIDFVLDELQIRSYFFSIVSAFDVPVSKPNPDVFLKGAQNLGVAPENCIVFEDAPKGVEAAANAGMKAVAITTMHTEEEFSSYNNIIAYTSDYNTLMHLIR
ncbi:HAD family hydrolase [Sediminibacterium sp. TEGAF015]|uniref:HAD family hydrolase n=1 Tax=Sediminibacterium sp. TEGAF015 TaxID=575378 RepID=UPI0021FDBD80|nr:HAD family phosphatase [Sediminibacterium sp. TEGAF015]BDQ12765.1 beta-phosphoglucomutase [Sediminibacterium sp. TEGAF015]